MTDVLLTQRVGQFQQLCVTTSQGCWEWFGKTSHNGRRGKFKLFKNETMAYRAGFILAGFTIPKGMTLDHVCQNPGCVNPLHMEVCTQEVNWWREANAAKLPVLVGRA